MLDFLLLILADVLLACNFAATKGYQKNEGVCAYKGLLFNAVYGGVSAIIIAAFCGFKLQFGVFSAFMAFGMAALLVAYTLIGFVIMKSGTMALYTIFLMSGGMVVPYIWGLLFLDEPFSVLRTVGLAVIVTAVVLSNSAIKNAKFDIKQLALCSLVFLLNGFTSVVSKEHQISSIAISTMCYMVMYNGFRGLICLVLLMFTKRDKTGSKISGKSLILICFSCVVMSLSSYLQLTGAQSFPATVLYPVITGGTIIFTALAGRIVFKEKITLKMWLCLVMCFIGTCMFL